MSKIMIYPYNPLVDYFEEYAEMIQDYEKVVLVLMSGVKRLKKKSEVYEVINDWKDGIEQSDTILLIEGLSDKEKYQEIVKYSLKAEKKILAEAKVIEFLDRDFRSLVSAIHESKEYETSGSEILHEIDIPIISIMAMGENTAKLRLELAAKEQFENEGFKVLLYGSNPLSTLFGAEVMPDFMFENISLTNKILALNKQIYSDIQEKKPDIVIIGCAGGIMPYNRYIHNYFGEIPLAVSKAIPIDINLIISYFLEEKDLDGRYLTQIETFCKENFECGNNLFTMSNVHINFNREKLQAEYMILDKKLTEEQCKKVKSTRIFDSTNMCNRKNIFTEIQSLLETDFQVI